MATQELEARFQELWSKAFRGGVVHPLITLMLENLQAQIAALKASQEQELTLKEALAAFPFPTAPSEGKRT